LNVPLALRPARRFGARWTGPWSATLRFSISLPARFRAVLCPIATVQGETEAWRTTRINDL
jgi:hypothetical protein